MKDNVKLGTLGDIFIGLTYRPEDVANEGTIVLRSSNIQNGRLDFDDVVRVKCKVRENLIVKPNDILMCSRNGSAKLVGKCTLLPEMDEEMSFGAFMTIIRTQHNPYLLHFFNSNAFRCQLGSAATTTINQITRKMLDDISVPLYPKEQEDYIVSVFNQIDELIWIEAKKLDQLDELVKSRFIELFGDPVTNEKDWPRLTLGDICEIGSSKRVFEKDYVPQGIPFFRTKEIVELSKGNPISTELFISEEHFAELKKTYGAPKKGDLLISAVGTIGTIWIVSGDFEFYFKDGNLIQIKSSPAFNSIFMKYLLDELIANYKKEMSTGTAYSALTIVGLKKMLVYDVPLALQEQFATFVEQTDKSKLAVQQSIAELEELKTSLMQKFFG